MLVCLLEVSLFILRNLQLLPCHLKPHASARCRRDGAEVSANYKLPGGPKGARVDYIAYVFVFLGCIMYYLSNVQINPFRPSSSHSATERQSFLFKIQIFDQSALDGGGGERNLSPGLETAVGGPETHFYVPSKLPHGLYEGDMNTIKCKI